MMNEGSPKKIIRAEPSETVTQQEPIPQSNTRKWVRRILLVPLVPLLAIVGAWSYENTGRIVTTENAYVKANITQITSNVSGKVTIVAAQEHQHVKAGEVLFLIDADQFTFALEAAEAELTAARIEVEGLKSDYRQYGAELKEAKQRIRLHKLKLKRQKTLESKKFGRKVLMEEAQYSLAAARQHESAIRENSKKALISLRGDPDLPVKDHPSVQLKTALRDQATNDLANTQIIAPADGIVSNINLRAGEYIKVGAPIFSLIEVSNLWIEANLKETQLTYILEGQEAEFIADSYPDVKWPSQVDTISPATGAEFALLPAQNASGNWVKVVQRLPVRFSVTQTKGMPPLRAGMTVTVSIDTRRERKIKDLWASTKSSIRELQSKYLTSEYITSITETE
jgi:membrane fusion protein (multidrug efflux system)